jgi:hypothetical protein
MENEPTAPFDPPADFAQNVKAQAAEPHPAEVKAGKKIDRRSITSADNGRKFGGRPAGTLSDDKFQADTVALQETAARRILAGKSATHRAGKHEPPTDADRLAVARVCGISADEFERRLSDKLAALADGVIERVFEKIEQDAYKPEGLSFLLAVVLDKKARVDGRTGISGTTVNNQVNIYTGNAPQTRSALLDSLTDQPGAIEV